MKVKKLGFLDKLDIYIMRESFSLAVGTMKLPLAETVKTHWAQFPGRDQEFHFGHIKF